MKTLSRELLLSRLNLGLDLAVNLQKQLYFDLRRDWVTPLMDSVGFWQGNIVHAREELLRESILVDDCLFSDLFNDFWEAKRNLNYEEPVDLYVSNRPEVNAFSVLSFNQKERHIIVLHAALVNALTDKQIQCVIGHELGHLMNDDAELRRLVCFFYPQEEMCPPILRYKMGLLAQLNELRADRCGLIACGDLDASILSFLCMTAGVPQTRFSCDASKFIERCYQGLELIRTHQDSFNNEIHPEVPVRVCALEIFSKEPDEQVAADKIQEILSLLHDTSDDNMKTISVYALAGWLVANSDAKINTMELSSIISNMSSKGDLFPEKLIAKVKTADLNTLLRSLVELLKETNTPVNDLISYMLEIVVADREINQVELEFVRSFAEMGNLSEEEFAQLLAGTIRSCYRPILSHRPQEDDLPF